MDRRHFFTKSFQLGFAFLLGYSLAGCETKKGENETKIKDPCSDLSGVPKEEIESRNSYKYVSETPFPEKNCKNCELWIAPVEGKPCGGCELFEGSVHTNGYCDAWGPA